AHEADGHDPSRDADAHSRMFQLFSGSDRVVGEDLFDRVRVFVLGAVDRLSQRLNLFQLLAAQFVDVLVQGQRKSFFLVRKGDYKRPRGRCGYNPYRAFRLAVGSWGQLEWLRLKPGRNSRARPGSPDHRRLEDSPSSWTRNSSAAHPDCDGRA